MVDLFDSIKEMVTQRPANLKNPHFYKASSDAKSQLEQLREIYKIAPSNVKPQIEQDIKILTYGIAGEDNVAFELNNSHLPIIVLHDLHIEHNGLSAQIDYFIITPKFNLIIECKNLIGNIEVNSSGDFIRTIEYNGRYKKEGIYSPITQNIRHIELIKEIRLTSKNNFFTKTIFEKHFDENYKTVVVLANPKTVINMKYAKKEVKEQIIRSDQLIAHIKKLMNVSKNDPSSEKEMYELADFFLSFHKPNNADYTKKYSTVDSQKKKLENKLDTESMGNMPLYRELKQYRYEISIAEGVKPYFIYNNVQMEAIIAAMPKTLDDIKKISGFGEIKCQKYGNDILKIIQKYN